MRVEKEVERERERESREVVRIEMGVRVENKCG